VYGGYWETETNLDCSIPQKHTHEEEEEEPGWFGGIIESVTGVLQRQVAKAICAAALAYVVGFPQAAGALVANPANAVNNRLLAIVITSCAVAANEALDLIRRALEWAGEQIS